MKHNYLHSIIKIYQNKYPVSGLLSLPLIYITYQRVLRQKRVDDQLGIIIALDDSPSNNYCKSYFKPKICGFH